MYTKINNYEEIIFRKHPKYIKIWLSIILLSFIFFSIIAYLYEYHKFYEVDGLVVKAESDSYIQILVENEKLGNIKNGRLRVGNEYKDFYYDISSNIYSESGTIYRDIKIIVENDYDNKELVTLLFVLPKTTILREIKEKLRKEIKL